MSGNDRNIVNIGPATIKVEDSIYDAVDQGIVTATTATTTTATDTGFTPIGPIGDLITPPTLPAIAGYPITAAAISFTESELSPSTPWAVLDLSTLGSFTNALVLNYGSGIGIVNLDNPTQRTVYAGAAAKNWYEDFRIVDGYLTAAMDVFSLGTWTNPAYDLGPAGTKTAQQIQPRWEANIQDATYHYFNYNQYFYVQPHAGPLGPLPIAAATTGTSHNTIAVAGSVLWGTYVSGGTTWAFPIDIMSGATGAGTNLGAPDAFGSGIIWGLNTGAVAGLREYASGSNYVYDLTIIDVYGGVTTQVGLMSMPNTYALQTVCQVPGAGICLVVFYDTATGLDHTYQVSPAGYQAVTMPTDRVRYLRPSPVNPAGLVRWWGSSQAGTGDALYEAAL